MSWKFGNGDGEVDNLAMTVAEILSFSDEVIR